MNSKFEYFEKASIASLGRAMKHVLLLHANALNADHFSALVGMMRQRGYAFVTLEEALTDSAYALPDTYAGAEGISWLQRWAITKGVDKTFFAGEPTTPEFVMQQAGIASE